MSVEEIREFIGADSLGYLSLDGLLASCGDARDTTFCTACYTNRYPTVVDAEAKTMREKEPLGV